MSKEKNNTRIEIFNDWLHTRSLNNSNNFIEKLKELLEESDQEIKELRYKVTEKNEEIEKLQDDLDKKEKSSNEWCNKAMEAVEQRRSVQTQLNNLKRDYDFLVMARDNDLVSKIDSLQEELLETYVDRQRIAVLCQDRNEQISKMRKKFDIAIHLLEHSISFVGTKSCSSEVHEAIEKFLKDLNCKTK